MYASTDGFAELIEGYNSNEGSYVSYHVALTLI